MEPWVDSVIGCQARYSARRLQQRIVLMFSSRWAMLLLLALSVLLVGCTQARYYGQAVVGQLSLLAAREPVAEVLADANTEPGLAARLAVSQRMLSFLQARLHLNPAKRYRSYVQLDRSAVVYNLVVTPNLSVDPLTWCYPFVGCAPYRGYFRESAALRASQRYLDKGLTTHVGAVPAYSTLGWFEDPLLSTFIFWPDAELVELLAHEVAHSKLWVSSDVAFNEAFASFVGQQAAHLWSVSQDPAGLAEYLQRRQSWHQLRAQLLALRQALQKIYQSAASAAVQQARAAAAYQALRDCYAAKRDQLGAGRYDTYVAGLNNAALAALATYANFQPAFARLFETANQQWPAFYTAAQALGGMEQEVRHQRLQVLAKEHEARAGNDQSTNQVQCKPLSSHGLHAEFVGAVDNHIRGGGHR